MAGDAETGVCIMQMEEGLDTGPVMAQQQISIEPGYTAQPLEQILADTGSELLLETLQNLPMAATPQAAEGATYANKLTSKDRIVDWQGSAQVVHQQVRALSDRTPVRCEINGAVMQILSDESHRSLTRNKTEADANQDRLGWAQCAMRPR